MFGDKILVTRQVTFRSSTQQLVMECATSDHLSGHILLLDVANVRIWSTGDLCMSHVCPRRVVFVDR